MEKEINRRKFLGQFSTLMSTPFIFSAFKSKSIFSAGKYDSIKIGCAAITWGDKNLQAIDEIASLGFKGVQLRLNILREFEEKTEELSKILKGNNLSVPMFSGGDLNITTGNDEEQIEKFIKTAKFLKKIGGTHLQITNSSRPKDGSQPTKEDLIKYSHLLNVLGKKAKGEGINICYHNHMHQLGETPEEVDIIMENTDPSNVLLLLDIAHYFQGGGDPAKAIKKYKSRLAALHIKDVKSPSPKDPNNPKSYVFVELGNGKINIPAVFDALEEIKFNGWTIVELDYIFDNSKTPKEATMISKNYLKEKLKIKI